MSSKLTALNLILILVLVMIVILVILRMVRLKETNEIDAFGIPVSAKAWTNHAKMPDLTSISDPFSFSASTPEADLNPNIRRRENILNPISPSFLSSSAGIDSFIYCGKLLSDSLQVQIIFSKSQGYSMSYEDGENLSSASIKLRKYEIH